MISNFKSQITYSFVKCGCSIYCFFFFFVFFFNSANLICRGMDISKYFRESLGLRDNDSRLYILPDTEESSILIMVNVHKFCPPKSLIIWHIKTSRPRSDCAFRSSLIKIYTVCHFTKCFKKQLHKNKNLGQKNYGPKCSKF